MRIELAIACLVVGGVLAQIAPSDDYLRWSAGDAERVGREAFLQVKDRPGANVRGTIEPRLRDVRALAGVLRRNYDYDRFWVTFSTTVDGKPLFGPGDRVAQLIVRIHEKEGKVEWPVPVSLTKP